jgi:hypothetical protein
VIALLCLCWLAGSVVLVFMLVWAGPRIGWAFARAAGIGRKKKKKPKAVAPTLGSIRRELDDAEQELAEAVAFCNAQVRASMTYFNDLMRGRANEVVIPVPHIDFDQPTGIDLVEIRKGYGLTRLETRSRD